MHANIRIVCGDEGLDALVQQLQDQHSAVGLDECGGKVLKLVHMVELEMLQK
jgi:hypothetical protein